MAIMAEMATGICTGVGRSIKFFHMPVPIDRTEDAPEEGRVRNGLAAGGNQIRTRGPVSGGEPARTNEFVQPS
jgi:hypothetical protein